MLNAVLNPPKRNTCWCGPSAISIITGCGYDDAIARLKLDTGKTVIKGVAPQPIKRVLYAMGFSSADRELPTEPLTLAAWEANRPPVDRDKTFLVMVTGHYLVVKGRKACDNRTKAPVWLKDMHSRRARVQHVWEVVSHVQPGEEAFAKEASAMGVGWRVEPMAHRLTVFHADQTERGCRCTLVFRGSGYWQKATAHLRALRAAGVRLA